MISLLVLLGPLPELLDLALQRDDLVLALQLILLLGFVVFLKQVDSVLFEGFLSLDSLAELLL